MPRQICFMIMPYGQRTTLAAGNIPDKIDFDALWHNVLEKFIDEDLDCDPVRADQDLGALIIKEMIERLAIADYVMADLTIPNGNVYYEVGVRHAAVEKGCVLVAAEGSRQLFDVDQMRRVAYPMPEGSINDATAAAIRARLKESVQPLLEGQSPVFMSLPGYPRQITMANAQVFRQQIAELSAFQTEVRTARRAPADQSQASALALLDKYRHQAIKVPAVAMELLYLLRDCALWPQMWEFVQGLPERVRAMPVVKEQTCLARSKIGNHAEAIAALEGLIEDIGDSSERRGLIGGRYKKLYADEHDPQRKKEYLSKAIDQYDRGMKLDLNDYFPASNLARLLRQRGRDGDEERARAAAAVTLLGCQRALKRNPGDPWIRPTLLGAAFDSGDVPAARRLYEEMEEQGAAPFHLESALPDLQRGIDLLKDRSAAAELEKVLANLKALSANQAPLPGVPS